MTYSAEISSVNPLLIGFLIDQSSSMGEKMAGAGKFKKSEICADHINSFLNSLILRNIDGQNIKNRCEIFAIGYGGNNEVVSALPDVTIDDMPINLQKLQSISKSVLKPKTIVERMPDGAGGTVEEHKKVDVNVNEWIISWAEGVTPMGGAFREAYTITKKWISSNSDNYPPIIFNITDGSWTDEDPSPVAEDLKNLKTDDGNVLVFNMSLSTGNEKPVLFPDNSYLDNNNSKESVFLFRMSSNLPDKIIQLANSLDTPISKSARGFGYNIDFASFIKFLDIGTRPAMG